MFLDRPGGPAGKPTLRFELPDLELGNDDMFYSVDGATPAQIGKSAFSDVPGADKDAPAKRTLTDADQIAKLLEAARNGRALRFDAKAGMSADTPGVSLDGLAAALLFIDDTQGRIGTETALARKGPKPASSVPAAPEPPRIAGVKPPKGDWAPGKAMNELWARHVRETGAKDCEGIGKDKDLGPDNIQIRRLSAGLVLYSLPCWRAAYQEGDMYYLGGADAKSAKRLSFEVVDEKTGQLVENLASLSDGGGLDDSNPTSLSSFYKGRGIGDCGTMASWTWTGSKFRLSSYAMMPECRGVNSDDWITLWRSGDK